MTTRTDVLAGAAGRALFLLVAAGTLPAVMGGAVFSPATASETPPASTEAVHIPPPGPALSGEKIPEWVARWELARVLGYLDRLEESGEQYDRLLRLRPELIEARMEQLNILSRLGQRDRVRRMLADIDGEGLAPELLLLLADVYVQMEDYEAAETIYRRHLESHPEAEDVRLRLAEILSWAQRYDESIAQYEILLDSRPDDVYLRRKYAFVLIWSGNRERGAEELMKTLD